MRQFRFCKYYLISCISSHVKNVVYGRRYIENEGNFGRLWDVLNTSRGF